MGKMKLVKPKAEIRIGRIIRAAWEAEIVEYESCFSISIDGEIVGPSKFKVSEIYTRKEPFCVQIGRFYRDWLQQKGIDPRDCRIINGERARSENSAIVPCEYSSSEDYELFRKALIGRRTNDWSRKRASSE